MPTLQPADEAFLASAPQRLEETFRIPRPASEVWAGLVAEKPLAWCRALNGRWTSPRPLGVGATREMRVLGLVRVQEHFFAWEEGRRHAFSVVSANLPLARRLAEDYVVEPDGDAACTLTWTIGVEPNALGPLTAPVNRGLFASVFRDTRKHFAAT